MKERELTFAPPDRPEIKSNNRVNHLTPEADRFFTEAIRYGAFSGLTFRTARIIDIYISTPLSHADLAGITGVTRARIGQIIAKGVDRLWRSLPDEAREQFKKEEPLIIKQIKQGFSPETRAKISEASKKYWKNKQGQR